jgi:hypothetical protein
MIDIASKIFVLLGKKISGTLIFIYFVTLLC